MGSAMFYAGARGGVEAVLLAGFRSWNAARTVTACFGTGAWRGRSCILLRRWRRVCFLEAPGLIPQWTGRVVEETASCVCSVDGVEVEVEERQLACVFSEQ